MAEPAEASSEETLSERRVCPSCGADPLLDGRYRLDEPIGKGASSTTWRATRLADGLQVAIKESVLRREEADEASIRVEREAAVLRQLHHPALPAWIEHFETTSHRTRSFWLVQQFLPGQDLEKELISHRYSENEVLTILHELCEVLTYLHGRSPPVIHRDLKPSNVIRTTDGRLALVDFGSVRDVLKGELGGNTVAGTFGYMAPEQFAGDATPRTDLYGLGALAVALLSREDPARLSGADGRLAWRDRISVSRETERLLEELLAADPAKRPPSAEIVRQRIARRGSSGPVTQPPASVRIEEFPCGSRPPVALVRRQRPAQVVPWATLLVFLIAVLSGGFALLGIGAAVVVATAGVSLEPSPPSPSNSNAAACRKYVQAFNDTPCAPVDLKAEDLCPATLDRSPCELGSYYECMAEAIECNGDFLDISRQANCSVPRCI